MPLCRCACPPRFIRRDHPARYASNNIAAPAPPARDESSHGATSMPRMNHSASPYCARYVVCRTPCYFAMLGFSLIEYLTTSSPIDTRATLFMLTPSRCCRHADDAFSCLRLLLFLFDATLRCFSMFSLCRCHADAMRHLYAMRASMPLR